jgi:hypothetical protein
MALLAGPGGCSSLDTVEEFTSEFFRGVRIYRGRCLSEHGNKHKALVATDSTASVYLLGAPSGWRFLTAVHAPRIPSGSGPRLREFAALAVEMNGQLIDGTDIVVDDSLPVGAQGCRSPVFRDTSEKLTGYRQAFLLGLGPTRATWYRVFIGAIGNVSFTANDCWQNRQLPY